MEFIGFMVPSIGMLIFDVSKSGLLVLQFVKVINGLAEKFEVTVKQHLREHEFLVDGEAISDLANALKILRQCGSHLLTA